MKNRIFAGLVLTSAGLAASLQAAEPDGAQLARALKCHACHSLEEPLIGPPYQAIAARHSAERQLMTEVLARKIVRGGGGNWGLVPMVPNEHVSEEDARTLARWILAQ
jgi:cytochrome c